MPSASAKLEKQGSLEVLEPLKQILTVVEKKVRNLEKRKGKLDAYKSDSNNGKELNEDQKKAVEKYDQVVEVLEFAKDMQKQFTSIIQETSKTQKKIAKREQQERQQQELLRFKEMITIQEILNSMGGDDVREDFLHGTNGAVKLTEEELNGLDELYKLICPDRDEENQGSGEFDKQLSAAAEHFQALLDSKSKEVIGTTYKALREVIMKIHSCTYFNKSGVSNCESETGDNTNDAKEIQETAEIIEEQTAYSSASESKTEEPSIPPGLSPNQGEQIYFPPQPPTESPSSFQDQTRPLQDVLPVQGNLNFLQESQINLESATSAHPVVSNSMCYPGNFVSAAQTSVSQDVPLPSHFQQRTKDKSPLSGHLAQPSIATNSSSSGNPVPTQQAAHLNFPASALPTQSNSNALVDFDPNRPIPTQTYTNQSFSTAIHPMMAAAAAAAGVGVAVPQNYVPVTLAQMMSHHVVGAPSVQQQQQQRGPQGVPSHSSLDPNSLTNQNAHPVSTAVSKLSLNSQDAKDCFVNRDYSMQQVSRENSHLNQPSSCTSTSQYERLNTHQGYQSAHNSQSFISQRDNFSTDSSSYSSNLKRGLTPRSMPRSGASNNTRGGAASVARSSNRGAYRT